jgi:hypothetical protein
MDKLRIKYGLAPSEPTAEQVRQWEQQVRALIQQKVDEETAGDRAARAVFPTYRQYKYATQGDTVNDLLQELARKKKP